MLILFSLLFIIGVVGIAVVIVRKIPLVLATPRQVIDDYFSQGSARVHIRVLRIRAWLKDGEYWDPILFFFIRLLRISRIFILKLDRYSFHALQWTNAHYERRKMAGNGNGSSNGETDTNGVHKSSPNSGNQEYWSDLKTAKDSVINLRKTDE